MYHLMEWRHVQEEWKEKREIFLRARRDPKGVLSTERWGIFDISSRTLMCINSHYLGVEAGK